MAGVLALYHYTKKELANAILKSGVIYGSTKAGNKKDDARYGNGVYLTSRPPSEGKMKLALNNYDGSKDLANAQVNGGKVDSFVVVELKPTDVVKVPGGRDIYLYPGDLIIEDHMNVASGDVVKK